MRTLIVLSLLAAALAGCSDGGPTPSPEDDTFSDFGEVEVTDKTGIIRGIVVDPAIFPLVGAKVTLQPSGAETVTNENGAFLFADLEPGSYFLKARAIGFKSVQASAQVEAGVRDPAIVKILLPADPSGTPYFKPHYFAGYIWCGTNYVAVCGGLRDFGGVGDDTYSALYDTDANITHLQSEMVWSNTQQFGDSFSVSHRYATQEQFDGGFYEGGITSGSGKSPLLVVTDVDDYNDNNVGSEYEFLISIFAGRSVTEPTTGVGFGMALEQDYEMFIHEFHGYMPPEGWRFSENSDVPPPA